MFEMTEHKEIFDILKQRNDTPLSEYITMEDLAKKFNINLDKI